MRLSERTNEYFIKILGQWLISDSVASYFVFDLGGFEFLLDTIGQGETEAQALISSARKSSQVEGGGGIMKSSMENAEEAKDKAIGADLPSSKLSLLEGSDLAQYLESALQEF